MRTMKKWCSTIHVSRWSAKFRAHHKITSWIKLMGNADNGAMHVIDLWTEKNALRMPQVRDQLDGDRLSQLAALNRALPPEQNKL